MVFHWSLNGSKTPGLVLIYWPISTMLYFGWPPLVILFPSPLVPVPNFWWIYQAWLLQLASLPLSCYFHRFFFQFSCKVQVFIFLFILLQFYSDVNQKSKVHYSAGSPFFFFFLLSLDLVVWPRLGDPFVSQNTKEFCACHFLGQIHELWIYLLFIWYYYLLIRVFHIIVSWWSFTGN